MPTTLMTAWGLHAIFQVFPSLRLALQIAGGLYLLRVASRLWRSGASMQVDSHTPVSRAAAFRLGFLTNITNPKSALFFGSVFATTFPHQPGVASTGRLHWSNKASISCGRCGRL